MEGKKIDKLMQEATVGETREKLTNDVDVEVCKDVLSIADESGEDIRMDTIFEEKDKETDMIKKKENGAPKLHGCDKEIAVCEVVKSENCLIAQQLPNKASKHSKADTSDPQDIKNGAPRLHGSVKEITACDVVKSGKCLGSGTFGSCYLANYRGIMVAVKEFHLNPRTNKKAIKQDVLYEAAVISRLGDHPGLPLLFGISTIGKPYRLITQFHGDKDESLTLFKAIKKLSLNFNDWSSILKKRVHEMGFLHNDLKSNNIVMEKREQTYNPVIIDFGKARRKENAK
jgi:serine/threonine protein kinase